MTYQEFFEKEYKYRSYEQKIANARYDYKQLQNKGLDPIELVCVVSGANGGVNDAKYRLMVDLTNDRASYGSFSSLISAMYTPYTVERVCKRFHKDQETMNSAIAIILLFASIRGSLSSDDNKMINLIYFGQ